MKEMFKVCTPCLFFEGLGGDSFSNRGRRPSISTPPTPTLQTQHSSLRKQMPTKNNNYTFLIEGQQYTYFNVGSCVYGTHWGGKIFLLTAASK